MTERLKTIKKQLKKELDKQRYEHTVGVMYTASCLAMRYGSDINQAMTAGLLHDCAKCISGEKQLHLCKKHHIPVSDAEWRNPVLLHAKLGAFFAKTKYGVEDAEVLHAIKAHTTGEPGMNLLDKILYVSDYIEPNRYKAPDLEEIRSLAFENIDDAVYRILKDTIHFLNQKKGAMDTKTMDTYKYYKRQKGEENGRS